MKFPSLTDYEKAVSKSGESFNTLDIKFQLFKEKPFKLYMYGCGQFAIVFKGEIKGKNYAIRCFQQATKDSLNRYKALDSYLGKKKLDWLCKFEFIPDEISVNNKKYPVLLMDWVKGMNLQDYVSSNLNNKKKLTELQSEFVNLSKKLEKNKIGHGDIQDANILINDTEKSIKLRLIDYDGMFVPELEGLKATELGKPAYQHPNRSYKNFNEEIDRFSLWLIITALEAIKWDPSLWKRKKDGGFNNGSNCLFDAQDLEDTKNSILFSKLLSSKNDALINYTNILIGLCNSKNMENIKAPSIIKSKENIESKIIEENDLIIESKPSNAIVLNSQLHKLGKTPLKLNSKKIKNKNLIIVSSAQRININIDKDVVDGKIFKIFNKTSKKVVDEMTTLKININKNLNPKIFINSISEGLGGFSKQVKVGSEINLKAELFGYEDYLKTFKVPKSGKVISVDLIKKKNTSKKTSLIIKDHQKKSSKLQDDQNKKPKTKNDKKELSIVLKDKKNASIIIEELQLGKYSNKLIFEPKNKSKFTLLINRDGYFQKKKTLDSKKSMNYEIELKKKNKYVLSGVIIVLLISLFSLIIYQNQNKSKITNSMDLLTTKNKNLNSQISSLNNIIEANESQILELSNLSGLNDENILEIEELKNDNSKLRSEVSQLKRTISRQRSTISNLQNNSNNNRNNNRNNNSSNLNRNQNNSTNTTPPPTNKRFIIGNGSLRNYYSSRVTKKLTDNLSPFPTNNMRSRKQYVIRAFELKNEGIKAGYITKIGFLVLNGNDDKFDVRVGLANISPRNNYNRFYTTREVYNNKNIYWGNPDGRNISILLEGNGFYYDGTSDLIIEICMTNKSTYKGNDSETFLIHYDRVDKEVTNFFVGRNGSCNSSSEGSYYYRPKILIWQ